MKLWVKNTLLMLVVVILTIIPLWVCQGAEFGGADGEAEGIIYELAPDYEPIFEPLLEPASGEIESMLFALQAAIGSGVVCYCIGYLMARKKYIVND